MNTYQMGRKGLNKEGGLNSAHYFLWMTCESQLWWFFFICHLCWISDYLGDRATPICITSQRVNLGGRATLNMGGTVQWAGILIKSKLGEKRGAVRKYCLLPPIFASCTSRVWALCLIMSSLPCWIEFPRTMSSVNPFSLILSLSGILLTVMKGR